MRYKTTVVTSEGVAHVHVIIDQGESHFTSFPAKVDNPNYDSFLESQSLTDADVQEMTPDVWHDVA